MNQSGEYKEALQGIVATAVTPYKNMDYAKIKHLKDKTFLLADHAPISWEVNQEALRAKANSSPSALRVSGWRKAKPVMRPGCRYAIQSRPGCGGRREYRFVFGPARSEQRIAEIRRELFLDTDAAGEIDSCAPSGNMAIHQEGRGSIQFPRRMRISTMVTTGCPGRCTITGRPTV